jgi:CDP-glucose 4,6-dehydratase
MEKLVRILETASPKFWCGKRVFLTGHSGFKGAWLSFWLNQMGAKVTGVSLPPSTNPNLFTLAKIDQVLDNHYLDIRDSEELENLVLKSDPEIVLHLAAQALVRTSYDSPLATFSTNVMGTANLLNAIRKTESVRAAVFVTTDKVYKNREHAYPYREKDTLGGYDPYSASKAASEIVIDSYRDSFLSGRKVAIASARAGNVIGGGDWSENRLIPDAIKAWNQSLPIQIRRPDAVRPWQHVLEPLNSYLVLAEKLYKDPELSGAYNFGPHPHEVATVRKVIEMAQDSYGVGDILWGDGLDGPHEAGLLSLETSKARVVLGIVPRWNLEEAIARTMSWYKNYFTGSSIHALCDSDIMAFLDNGTRKS